jgi:hypothetical protein
VWKIPIRFFLFLAIPSSILIAERVSNFVKTTPEKYSVYHPSETLGIAVEITTKFSFLIPQVFG